MRKLFTTDEAIARGISPKALRWGAEHGKWRRVIRGVYGEGPEDPSPLDIARATVMATDGMASDTLAGVMLGLDAVALEEGHALVAPGRSPTRSGVRRRLLDPDRVIEVAGMKCTDGVQTMVHLAAHLDDLRWEQALESALRQGHCTVAELEAIVANLHLSRVPGAARMRRVLALRPQGAPATGSILETHAVQLVRPLPLPEPERQVVVRNRWGDFVAIVDLLFRPCLFWELDGEGHKDQPLYDARRETAIVAATGWLPARSTWTEVVHLPRSTSRRMIELYEQAQARRTA